MFRRDITEESADTGYFGVGLTPKEDEDMAFLMTISGTDRLIQMKENGVPISDDEINTGIEINAKKLGISVERYRGELEEIKKYRTKDNTKPNSSTSQ